ncbi:MAG: histidine--tRNA ligase [Gammaproteobacteria bacterium]|nr:histidine--tRNA ligase [Gammaproteobacteria bacterium]
MSQILRAVRGMNDTVPPIADRWRRVEADITRVLGQYGYREIRFPIVESTQVFARSIGDTTDIVQKEMYTFEDRNGDSLTLRPEGTASCVRAVLENGLLKAGTQRLFYLGPMFRHERPQKGRYRQFHQVGVEALGMAGPDIDAELILMTARLWQVLGLQDLRLELNTLGTPESRALHREQLVAYFTGHLDLLDEDSRHRLTRNPLRILDSKNPALKALIEGAPRLVDFLDAESRDHFDAVRVVLDAAGIAYTVNPHLVRGLDYYSKTVFEWITEALGAQGTVCAGGRYDGLVDQMGGRATPAIGFAMGLERLMELLPPAREEDLPEAELYVIGAGMEEKAAALALAEAVRDALPGVRVLCHCGQESLKSQLKRADRSGAAVALILGSDELAAGQVTLKPLRGQGEQRRVERHALMEHLLGLLGAA